MIKVKTQSGFKCEVDERVLSDWRMVDYIGLIDSNDLTKQVEGFRGLVHLLLGDETKRLEEHIMSNNDGYIPTDIMSEELREIITSAKELKNSQSSEG